MSFVKTGLVKKIADVTEEVVKQSNDKKEIKDGVHKASEGESNSSVVSNDK